MSTDKNDSGSDADPRSAAATIERMREAAGCASDADFGRKFGLSRSNIAKWRARNSVPYDQIVRVSALTNANLNYLITGHPSGVEFVTVQTVDQGVLLSILEMLENLGFIGVPGTNAEEKRKSLKRVAYRVAMVYGRIENLARELIGKHELSETHARQIATTALVRFVQENDSLDADE